MKILNKDIEMRDQIIYGRYCKDAYKFGGVRKFSGLDNITLKTLIDQDFADPEESQNLAPSIEDIYEFMNQYPSYRAHGYTISDERYDYRISIEGVEKGEPPASLQEYEDFMRVFRFADVFNYDTMYCFF